MSEATRRMLIEDYELMAQARRAYLGWLAGRARQGETLSRDELHCRRVLEDDTRLEGALLMDWELRPEFDAAIVVALRFIASRESLPPAPPGDPELDHVRYLEHRNQAIDRVIRRLLGEV